LTRDGGEEEHNPSKTNKFIESPEYPGYVVSFAGKRDFNAYTSGKQNRRFVRRSVACRAVIPKQNLRWMRVLEP